MLRIGDEAPAFKAITTEGEISFPEDFEGKWVLFFSHPSDFTSVCTSELLTFGHLACEFEALNCQLVGLSVDSIPSHMAWLHTMEKMNYKGISNTEFHFPLIADLSMNIAQAYGMIHPGESTTQACAPSISSTPTTLSGQSSIIRWHWGAISTNLKGYSSACKPSINLRWPYRQTGIPAMT